MDYFNLQDEYDRLSNYTKTGISTLSDFSLFLKTYIKYSDQLIINTNKVLSNIISDMLKN